MKAQKSTTISNFGVFRSLLMVLLKKTFRILPRSLLLYRISAEDFDLLSGGQGGRGGAGAAFIPLGRLWGGFEFIMYSCCDGFG